MLALTKKVGEIVSIGDVDVKIISIKGYSEVVLGIDAPKHIRIRRDGDRRNPNNKPPGQPERLADNF